VTVWQLNQLAKGGQVLQAGQSALTALAFSPTGSRLAAADLAGALWIWNLAAPEEGVLHWEAHRSEISSLLFGGDQSQLYTASADRTVRLWNLSVEPPIPTVLAGHQASVNGLASLGGQLYTASTDGTLRQWLLTSVDLAKRACQVAGRNLDQEEWARFRPGERCRATCPGLPSRCGVDSPAATGP
jgi:WD40 repeat protein